MFKIMTILLLSGSIASTAIARDFMFKESCTLAFKGRAPIHTTCLVTGGLQGGSLDVSIRTLDGKTYALEGPVDGEEGKRYLLQNRPAKKTSSNDMETCYARNDGLLEICATPADREGN